MPRDKFATNADGSTAALKWGKSGVQLVVSADPSGGRGIVPPYVTEKLAQELAETGELHVGARPGQRVEEETKPETWVEPKDYREAWAGFQRAMGEKPVTVHWHDSEGDPRPTTEESVTFDLDRAAINQLIGALRRARDYTFGADA